MLKSNTLFAKMYRKLLEEEAG